MTSDPYPADLTSLDATSFAPASLEPLSEVPLIREVARIATALEQIALALLDNGAASRPPVVPTAPGLASLPPVQVVANKPACPLHGPDRVASSTNGKGGFYCQSKAAPGEPSNPKGYCTWHS